MNETVRRRREEFDGGSSATHAIMCECADPTCAEMLQVPADDLSEVRVDDDLFVVSPAHVGQSEVARELPGYVIVRFPSA